MVTTKETIEKIREIISKNYNRLTLSVLGAKALSPKELKELENAGIDTSNKDSLLSLIYHHNFINHPVDAQAPKSIQDMRNQQKIAGLKPTGEVNRYTEESINDKTKQYIDKLKLDIMTRVESIIRENNDSYKMNALQNQTRSELMDDLVKESTIGKLKQKLKDISGDGNRDWMRVAITEMSNAIGVASVDRIVAENLERDMGDIFVYRITVNDARTCKWCRRFYNDTDGTPRVYKLSTLLNNGSNYGKSTQDWQPVAGATHPNERCSQTIELKPGWKLNQGGGVTYMGLDKWKDYVFNKLTE